MNPLPEEAPMSKAIQPTEPEKKTSDKHKARIGFLESMGDSGYDNRTDPNYCFDILRKFMKKDDPDDETLG